ncbi:MAG TPA: FHA domain-containing protein [Vicinamibacteria bacterium]|nr:FHA domain-containing protein [Vicinamibacteria bacterium]
MIIVCPSCSSRYKFDETKLGSRPSARTKCAKCGGTIEIENPALGAFTLPPGAMPPVAPPATGAPPKGEPAGPPAKAAAPPEQAPAVEEKLRTKKVAVTPAVGEATSTGRDLMKAGIIEMPKDKRYSLAVLQGASTGQIFPVTRVRTTIGRAGADIVIDDPEASRVHAALEILGEHAILRDLGSTNGTFVDLEKIDQHVLYNQNEFRIGSHVLMFIVTEIE